MSDVDISQELRLSPGEAQRGCQRVVEVEQRTDGRVARKSLRVTVPRDITDGLVLRLSGQGHEDAGGSKGHLYLTIVVDPTVAPRPPTRARFWSIERGIGVGFVLLGAFLLVAALAFPLHEIGNPVVYVDPRALVGGIFGVLFGGTFAFAGSWLGVALRGWRRSVALALAAGVLFVISLGTWGVIRLVESFGYRLR